MKTWLRSCLEITFWLVLNLFTVWVGSSIICVYPADDVCERERERERKRERDESCSRPAELVISFFHHLEVLALKWFVATEQIRNAPFMLSRSVSEFTQKFWNSSWFRIEEQKMQVKKDFSFCERISVTKQLSKI